MNLYWLIQGHTKYYREICSTFGSKENIYWVTEKDSPNLGYILGNSNIKIIPVERVEHGFGRILIHSKSTTQGLKYLKSLGADTVIKLRSDLIVDNLTGYEELVQQCISKYPDKLFGHCYVKHGGLFIDNPILTTRTREWLFSLGSKIIESDQNYITDWIHSGNIDELILFYEGVRLDNYNDPIICEIRFIASYFLNKGYDLNFTYEYLTDKIKLMLGLLYNSNINLFSLKEGMNYSKMHITGEHKSLPDNFLP